MSVTATCGLLEDPDRFAGKRFDLGGGDLTGNDVLAILSRVTGRLFNYFQVVPLDIIRERKGEDGAKMYELFVPCRVHGRSHSASSRMPRRRLSRLRVVGEGQAWNR
jgi:hypothetical protein